MEIRLTGKRALVTGANSGIGRAIALALGALGARVGVNYVVQPEAAQAAAAEITGRGSAAIPLEADVSDAAQVARMFGEVDRAWGGLDILVNNAGIDGERALGWDAGPDAWRRVLEINLVGAYLCAREALRRMVAQGSGVILNITSVHERIPWSGYSAYTASKAGLGMLTRTLAQEAAPHGVRVLALAPGAVQTPINRAVWGDPVQLADLLRKIPMGRLGRPEEIASMAAVLVSDVAGYVTGTTVLVDGGMTLYPSFMHGG
jgi:NAD(P)-dependent dehydrogenase (short-subunit alcohol dehydrogenase family)